jgi:hypothetical protein
VSWGRVGQAKFKDEHVCLQRLACVSRDLNAALKKIFCLFPFNLVANTSQGLGLQVQKYRLVFW